MYPDRFGAGSITVIAPMVDEVDYIQENHFGAPSGRTGPAVQPLDRTAHVEIRRLRRLLPMDALTVFGALAVSAMLLFYALEHRSAAFVLAFAGACLASSAYGFLQGAWPFGVVELIWSGVAVRRWWLRARVASS